MKLFILIFIFLVIFPRDVTPLVTHPTHHAHPKAKKEISSPSLHLISNVISRAYALVTFSSIKESPITLFRVYS